MDPRDKAPTEVSAQVEAFVGTTVPYGHDAALKHELGNLATPLSLDTEITTAVPNFLGRVESRTTTYADYVEFLRQADPETRQDIKYLATKLDAHSRYKEKIAEVQDEAHFLGSGSNGKVYKFEQDAIPYAVKIGGVEYGNIRAFRRGDKIDGIAHMESVDIDAKESVMNLVEGREIETIPLEGRQNVPIQHIESVINKAIEMHEAGLKIDPKPSNFLYSEETGFGILDYRTLEESQGEHATLSNQVLNLTTMLCYSREDQAKRLRGEPKDFETEIQQITLITRLLDVLESQHPDILTEAAQIQAAKNEISSSNSANVISMNTIYDGPVQTNFKARLSRLGLVGKPPVARSIVDDDDGPTLVS